MDITAQIQASQALNFLGAQNTQLDKLQNQISSGSQLQEPSDNPANYITVMNASAQNANYTSYLSTIGDATSTLNSGVSALTNINSIITQAESLTQQGINGATDPSGLPALADQVNSLLGSVLSNANTQVNGQYIFGGTATDKQPFVVSATDASGNPSAVTYQGSNTPAQALIGPAQTVNTRYAGNGILQQQGTDLFQTLMNIRDDLNNSNLSQNVLAQDLTQQFSTLQQAGTNVQDAMGEQSASLQNLSSLQTQIQQLQLNNQTAISNLQDTNYASAAIQLTAVQNAMQATLEVSSKIFNQNLLDFIQ